MDPQCGLIYLIIIYNYNKNMKLFVVLYVVTVRFKIKFWLLYFSITRWSTDSGGGLAHPGDEENGTFTVSYLAKQLERNAGTNLNCPTS